MKQTAISPAALLLILATAACQGVSAPHELEEGPADLSFPILADRWDEGVPLGNGVLGGLLWSTDGRMRLAIDRIDLWDLRLQEEMHGPDHTFKRLFDLWENDRYAEAIRFRDELRRYPYPTKIPGAALEWEISNLGEVDSVRLLLQPAVCEVRWNGGAVLRMFIHAEEDVGWFRFSGLEKELEPVLLAPAYTGEGEVSGEADQARGSLTRLGYPEPRMEEGDRRQVYRQETSLGNGYEVFVQWRHPSPGEVEGSWSISPGDRNRPPDARGPVVEAMDRGWLQDLRDHRSWWNSYWARSSVTLPDSVIERHWYREMYKFGAATGHGTIPISLQSVWTADNGELPPWAGDFHHDLNTQLSYWPAYTGNQLEQETAFVDWLWRVKPEAEQYTERFFEADGLAFPGVTDIEGRAMGGWWQYTHNPTVAAWLGTHFYEHWRYTMDEGFLRERAYPWIRAAAEFLQDLSVLNEDGRRRLPLSSSPEINDDRPEAWFEQTTNFDLALVRWTLIKAAEMAQVLGLEDERKRWTDQLREWPELALGTPDEQLLIAPDYPLPYSHRHFSHLVAIHPLGLVDAANGENDRRVIESSLAELDRLGTSQWVGYSFSWLAALRARAGDGAGAAEALRIFAGAFCSPNTFHLNGDQTASGYSNYTYRPFTLEGNFAFAAGAMEMLLQSHNGLIRVFPAVPEDWKDVSFESFRASGAFVVSAFRQDGDVGRIRIHAEKGGELRILDPWPEHGTTLTGIDASNLLDDGPVVRISTVPGDRITLTRGET
jgi:alpha-L-fucosidase 2